MSRRRRRLVHRRQRFAARALFAHVLGLDPLERRRLLSSPVELTSYHNDGFSTGQNLAETILTPANVNSSTFGLLSKISLDGQVYAQPLLKANVNVTHLDPSSTATAGIHNVLYVATQHATLYALDAESGALLWKDTFLNVVDPTSAAPTSGVTPVPATDVVNSADVAPEIGILATPTIDTATNTMYLDVNTKESRSEFSTTNKHYVQRLWAVDIGTGAALRSTVIADTIMNSTSFSSYSGYEYVSGPWINGTGNNGGASPNADGWIVNPNDSTSIFANTTPSAAGKIAFNALLQMNRPAVTQVGQNIYLGYASHGDDGPYYGWLLGFNAQTFAPTGVFNTTPTYKGIVGNRAAFTAQGGIWMSGDRIASDGTNLFVTTGNGAFDEANANFDANGFPIDHNFADCLLKVAPDPTSNQNSQNGNGWGLKVADYFTPSNQLKLNQIDADLGSGGVLLIDTASIPGHPHVLVTGGKEGRVYLIDRDNMGKFNLSYPKNATTSPYPDPLLYDRVLGESQGNATNSQTKKFYSTASYFNGKFTVGLSGNNDWVFNLATFPTGTVPPNTQTTTKDGISSLVTGSRGSTFSISANGTSNGVYWSLVNNASYADDLQAYSAAAFTGGATVFPIYDSNSVAGDALSITNSTNAVGVKFNLPTVANGLVYSAVGTKNNGTGTLQFGGLIIYGLRTANLNAPTALAASATGTSSIHLTWSRGGGDQESVTRIERSTDGVNWAVAQIVGNGTSSYDDTALAAGTKYFYRVTEIYAANASAPSTTANATTNPSITNVTSTTADGPYMVAAVIPVRVTFTDLVNVTGAPTLSLNDGGVASYASGSGTSTLVFNYTVGAGQNTADLDYASVSALSLNGGTIKDAALHNAALALPAPGAAGSLGANKNIVIDTIAPAATGANVFLPGATPQLNVTFSEHVISLDPTDVTITPQGGGSSFNPTGVSFNSGTNTATFTFASPVANGVYHATLAAGSVTDDAGNPNANPFSFDFILVNGAATFALPAGTTKVNQVMIGSGGKLDVGTSSLIVDYSGASPIAALASQIASGRNGGDWSGSGIVTSAASGNLTTLAVAESSQVLGPTGGAFGSQSADGTSVLIKYTYGGDANLDGKINVDDYGRIDFNVNLGTSGYFNGDFNYDGKINVDDYGIIDFNVGIQGPPLAGVANPTASTTATPLSWFPSRASADPKDDLALSALEFLS